MPTPTFISAAATALNTTTTPKTLSVTVAVGDDLLVLGTAGDASTILGTPTGGSGFTWTLLDSSTTASNTAVYLWKATATSAQTFTLSVARTGTNTNFWGFGVIRFSGVTGYGTPAKTTAGSGAPSQAITTVEANSTLAMATADWSAITGTRTYRAVNGFTPTVGGSGEVGGFNGDGVNWGVSIGYWPDAGATGSKTVGTTAPTGQKFTIIAVEVKGTAGGGTNFTANPADALGLTDAATVVQNFVRTPADPEGLTDSATPSQGFTRTPADPEGLTDAESTDSGRLPADSGGITDTITSAQGFSRLPADPEGLTDTTVAAQDFVRTPADLVGLTDSVTATIGAIITQADPLGITDGVTVTTNFARLPADPLGGLDATSVVQDDVRGSADPSGLADVLTTSFGYVRGAADSVGMTDGVTAVITSGTGGHDITVTAALDPRRWASQLTLRNKHGSLDARNTTAQLASRTTYGTLNNRRWKGHLQ